MLFTALTKKKEKKGQYDCSKISRENKKRLKKNVSVKQIPFVKF